MHGAERLRAWHEGFSLHAGVVIADHDRDALERQRASPATIASSSKWNRRSEIIALAGTTSEARHSNTPCPRARSFPLGAADVWCREYDHRNAGAQLESFRIGERTEI